MHKVEEAAEPRAIAEGTKWWVEMGDGEVGTKGGLTPPGGGRRRFWEKKRAYFNHVPNLKLGQKHE